MSRLYLVYDPSLMSVIDAANTAAALSIGTSIRGFPPRLAPYAFPSDLDPYIVVRERWDGVDILAAPVAKADIDNLPAETPDPSVEEKKEKAAASGVMKTLRETPIDTAKLDTNLKAVAAFRKKQNRTQADYANVMDPLIDVLADLIRYVVQS